MREYEVTIIISPELEDSARNALIERVSGWLTAEEGGEAPNINHWGQRRLAYPIRNKRDGYYLLYETKMEPQKMHQVERDILYEEDILRHLVVRKDS